MDASLLGAWVSTEAFGTTALDWAQALKDQAAKLQVEFKADGTYAFTMLGLETEEDVTAKFRHVVATHGKYEAQSGRLAIEGDKSGVQWTYQHEEDGNLRLRLEGAKRFGRCKGVDVIYLKRKE